VRDALNKAREQIAAFLHAESPEDIFFTSDGTESANLAIKGVAYANQRRGNHIVVSEIEHPSVLQSLEFLEKQGFHLHPREGGPGGLPGSRGGSGGRDR